MGVTYKTPRSYNPGISVFLATPAYESVRPGFAFSLALTTAELVRHGIPFEIAMMEENCHVDDGRNLLVRDFLEGECTDMFFLDSDIMWDARSIIKMLSHKDELVCGAYPKKCTPHTYPIGRILHTRHNGLLEVSYAPTGFMRIKRVVFETLLPTQSKHGKERPTSVFFERRFNGPTRDGGDVTFCRKWTEVGGKVVVDPNLIFSHIGVTRWAGRFLDYLADDENRARHFDDCNDPLVDRPIVYNSEKTFVELIEVLKTGTPSEETFAELADIYGNKPWAATSDFLNVAYEMAKNLPEDAKILECGCGLSTIVLAATGKKVFCLEEHKEWAEQTDKLLKDCGLDAEINVIQVQDDWYDVKQSIEGFVADFLIIDGPRRRDKVSRLWPLQNGIAKNGASILIDDVSSLTANGDFVLGGTTERPFIAGKLNLNEGESK